MKKINFKSELFSWIILFAVIILSVWAYPQLPERVSSHWNLQGEVDGWSSRKFHSLFFPILTIVMYFGLLLMPLLDPKKERYQEFIKTYNLIRHALLFVMGAIFFAATFFNLGYNINIGAIVGALVGALMIFLGNYFGKIKRNWFIGIRTPWTLSSENVWNKTHRFGGRLFMLWGLGMMCAPWLKGNLALIIIFSGLIFIILFIYVYSYLLFKQEKRK